MVVEDVHLTAYNGLVMMTIGKIRENCWIEKFRRLVKPDSKDFM